MSHGLCQFLIILFITFFGASSGLTAVNIGVLWDRSSFPSIRNITQNFEWVPRNNTKEQSGISFVDVTYKSFFAIRRSVCDLISEGTIAIMSVTRCHATSRLFTNQLHLPHVIINHKCPKDSIEDKSSIYYPPFKVPLGICIKDVILNMKWRELIMVIDNTTDYMQTALTTEALSKNGTTYRIIRIDNENVSSSVSKALKYIGGVDPEGYRILLLCSVLCKIEFLKQANDQTINQQGPLIFKVMWLLHARQRDLVILEKEIGNVSNVAVVVSETGQTQHDVHPGDKLRTVLELTYKALEHISVTKSNTDAFNGTGCQRRWNMGLLFHQNLRDQLQKACRGCDEFYIYSAIWKHEGRRLEKVGFWRQNKLSKGLHVFPNLRKGLNGKRMIITTNLWPPFMMKNESSGAYSGLCMELIKELSDKLNFSYHIIMPSDNGWGSKVNGSWTGLVGQMQRKEADIVVAPLAIQRERMEVMDFTGSYFEEYSTVLLKMPDQRKTKWMLYLQPFRWQVWLCIVAAVPFIAGILWTFAASSPFYHYGHERARKHIMQGSLWYAFGSMLAQGGVMLPKAQSGRTVLFFWWMYVIIMMATYSGNLIAFLTVTKEVLPFNTLEEMVEQTDYRFGLMGGTYWETLYKNARSGLDKKVWDRIKEFQKDDPDVISGNQDLQIKRVFAGGYAYLNDKTGFDIVMSERCGVNIINELFRPLEYGVGLQKNSAYKEMFTTAIRRTKESGLIQKWKKKSWPRRSFCSKGIVAQAKTVTLTDMQGAFYASGILLLMASLTLVTEYLTKSIKQMTSKESKKTKVTELYRDIPNGVQVHVAYGLYKQ